MIKVSRKIPTPSDDNKEVRIKALGFILENALFQHIDNIDEAPEEIDIKIKLSKGGEVNVVIS